MEPILTDLTIEVNQRCPNRCLFCSSLATQDSPVKLELKDILSVGKQAKELGLKQVSISGGEPLCHPDILDIVNGLAKQKLQPVIYTTGLVFGRGGSVEAFANWLSFKDANPTLIFNIQSSDPEIHDRIVRRQGALLLTKQALLHAKACGFKVEVHVVPNKINIDSIEATVRDLIEWGIERISFLRIVYQGYGRKNKAELFLNETDIQTQKDLFKRLYDQFGQNKSLRFGIPFSGIVEKPKHCNAGQSKLIIRYDGKVFPCEAFKDSPFGSEYILGDINHGTLSNFLSAGSNNCNLQILKGMACSYEPCPVQLLSHRLG